MIIIQREDGTVLRGFKAYGIFRQINFHFAQYLSKVLRTQLARSAGTCGKLGQPNFFYDFFSHDGRYEFTDSGICLNMKSLLKKCGVYVGSVRIISDAISSAYLYESDFRKMESFVISN